MKYCIHYRYRVKNKVNNIYSGVISSSCIVSIDDLQNKLNSLNTVHTFDNSVSSQVILLVVITQIG